LRYIIPFSFRLRPVPETVTAPAVHADAGCIKSGNYEAGTGEVWLLPNGAWELTRRTVLSGRFRPLVVLERSPFLPSPALAGTGATSGRFNIISHNSKMY